MSPYDRCGACGCRQEQHRGDGKCPSVRGWGRPNAFPAAFVAGEEKPDAQWDAEIAAYWSGDTTFRGVL